MMNTPTTIPRDIPPEPIDNFDALKQEAIGWLARSCAGQWTDFNASDPGVQILEELCYALTELGYRTAFPIGTILANPDGKIDWEAGAFFSPPQIFPMGPLTAKDYRKLILDRFPEVADLWVEAAGPADGRDGGLRVWLALDPDLSEDGRKAVCESVKRQLGEWRNLGEYFAEVRLAPEVSYSLEGEIKPAPGKDLASVTADLFLAVRRATAARPPAHPLEAGRAARRSLSEILTGPLLEHGEMLDEDLGEPRSWERVRGLAMAALLDFEDAEVTGTLKLGQDEKTPDPHSVFVFHFIASDVQKVKRLVNARERVEKAAAAHTARLIRAEGWSMPKIDPKLPIGMLTQYQSIQDGFPPNYALRENEAPLQPSPQRRSQIKQLKAYLLIFEQLLANFLAQLGKTGALLSSRQQMPTYFSQPIYDVPGVAPLLKGFNDTELALRPAEVADRRDAYRNNPANPYQRGLQELAEDPGESFRRQGQFLDHLLARFGEAFPKTDAANYETTFNKSGLLRGYPELGRDRALGAHHAGELNGDSHVSGLEARLACLLPRNEQTIWPDIPLFTVADFLMLPDLVARLNDHSDPVSQFLWSQFSLEVQQRLADSNSTPQQQGAALTEALNGILASGTSIYERERFAGVKLSEETVELLAQHPTAEGLIRLNRLLIAHAYPQEIGGSPKHYYLIEHCQLNRRDTDPGWRFALSHVFLNWTANSLAPNFQEYVENIVIESSGAHLVHHFIWFDREQAGDANSAYRAFVNRHRAWADAGFPCIPADGTNPPEAAKSLYEWVRNPIHPPDAPTATTAPVS
jgi:hypothetical protein